MVKHILLIGSADPTAGIPYQALPRRWYRVVIVADENEALQRLQQDPPDLVLLDASLPYNLTPLCAALQTQDPPLPVIVFVRSRPHARQVRKFNANLPLGVILLQPCDPAELTTTVSKLIRQVRQRRKTALVLQMGPLAADLARRQIIKNDQPIFLTPKQYDLLVLLMRHAGQIVSRQTIMQEIWQTSWMGDTRTLDVHIRMIRRGIEDDPSHPQFVRTVRGRGYVFQVPEPEPEDQPS